MSSDESLEAEDLPVVASKLEEAHYYKPVI